jgi:hypothetical protein
MTSSLMTPRGNSATMDLAMSRAYLGLISSTLRCLTRFCYLAGAFRAFFFVFFFDKVYRTFFLNFLPFFRMRLINFFVCSLLASFRASSV